MEAALFQLVVVRCAVFPIDRGPRQIVGAGLVRVVIGARENCVDDLNLRVRVALCVIARLLCQVVFAELLRCATGRHPQPAKACVDLSFVIHSEGVRANRPWRAMDHVLGVFVDRESPGAEHQLLQKWRMHGTVKVAAR